MYHEIVFISGYEIDLNIIQIAEMYLDARYYGVVE